MHRIVFLWALLAVAAPAAPDGPRERVGRAGAVSVTRDDLEALSGGLQATLFARPIEGSLDGTSLSDPSLGPYRFDRLDYRFDVRELDVAPEPGGVRARARIAGLTVVIHRIWFEPERIHYCDGLRLVTYGHTFPVELKVEPYVDLPDRVRARVPRATVGLTASDFVFKDVQSCHVIWPLNQLIARLVPGMANQMRGPIVRKAQDLAGTAAAQVNAALDELFAKGAPLAVLPLPAGAPLGEYLLRLRIFPSGFALGDSRARMDLGAWLDRLPPGETGYPPLTESELARADRDGRESYALLSHALANDAVNDALASGALTFPLDKNTKPEMEPILHAASVFELVPESLKRFKPEDELAIVLGGADHGRLAITGQPDPLTVAATLDVARFRMSFRVNGKPYYDFWVNGKLPLTLSLDPKTQSFSLHSTSLLGLALADHRFAPGLTPPPAAGDPGAKPEVFRELMKGLDELLATDKGYLASVRLPPLRFAGTEARATGLRSGPAWVAVSFRLRRR